MIINFIKKCKYLYAHLFFNGYPSYINGKIRNGNHSSPYKLLVIYIYYVQGLVGRFYWFSRAKRILPIRLWAYPYNTGLQIQPIQTTTIVVVLIMIQLVILSSVCLLDRCLRVRFDPEYRRQFCRTQPMVLFSSTVIARLSLTLH